jgi:hypothetical protein
MNRASCEPDRWRRIEELFQASIDLPADQRETLLREACGNDQELCDEVESLLSRVSPESPLIEGIIENATADLFSVGQVSDLPSGPATLHKRNEPSNT